MGVLERLSHRKKGEIGLNILFWDIDGTLMRTSKAGLYAFEQATKELWDATVDFDQIKSAGMTDHYIGAQIIEKLTGRHPLAEEIMALTGRYEQLLPIYLTKKDGRVMPSVFEILDVLARRSDYKLLLLTGNSRRGAEIKLAYFDLIQYFDVANSAFCDGHAKRGEIARAARQTLQSVYGSVSSLRIFVIGDTPHDIQCGKEIDAYTIGVATGSYSLEELNGHSPWWAVETLPPAAEFIVKIEQNYPTEAAKEDPL
jgi:phosphoglycolate phosphatase